MSFFGPSEELLLMVRFYIFWKLIFSLASGADNVLKLMYFEEMNPPAVSQSAYDLHGVLIDFASDVAVLMSLTVN